MAHALPLHGSWIASPGRERVVHGPGRESAISCSSATGKPATSLLLVPSQARLPQEPQM